MKTVLLKLALLCALVLLPGCADPDAEQPRKQVEHPNPMGGPSTYTYQ